METFNKDVNIPIGAIFEAEDYSEFYKNLEEVGLFPREYDPMSVDLYVAAQIIHRALCKLDGGYYKDGKGVMLYQFANAYAKTQRGLRKLE